MVPSLLNPSTPLLPVPLPSPLEKPQVGSTCCSQGLAATVTVGDWLGLGYGSPLRPLPHFLVPNTYPQRGTCCSSANRLNPQKCHFARCFLLPGQQDRPAWALLSAGRNPQPWCPLHPQHASSAADRNKPREYLEQQTLHAQLHSTDPSQTSDPSIQLWHQGCRSQPTSSHLRQSNGSERSALDSAPAPGPRRWLETCQGECCLFASAARTREASPLVSLSPPSGTLVFFSYGLVRQKAAWSRASVRETTISRSCKGACRSRRELWLGARGAMWRAGGLLGSCCCCLPGGGGGGGSRCPQTAPGEPAALQPSAGGRRRLVPLLPHRNGTGQTRQGLPRERALPFPPITAASAIRSGSPRTRLGLRGGPRGDC